MSAVSSRIVLAIAVTALAPACALDKEDPDKGLVDDSTPPSGAPGATGIGKADGSGRIIDLAAPFESAHPYQDYADETYHLDLDAVLPACAAQVRLHFVSLRVEDGYDFVNGWGGVNKRLWQTTGRHDDSWSGWIDVNADFRWVELQIEADYSIVDHGFVVDAVEWQGEGCPALGDVEIQYNRARGFNNQGKLARGTAAFDMRPGPADGLETYPIGSIDPAALEAVIAAASAAGLFTHPGYDKNNFSTFNVFFTLRSGGNEVAFLANEGTHEPAVQAVIDQFLALFTCDAPLTCDDEHVCSSGECVAASTCTCTEQYEPVCGEDNRTYGNDCFAACAEMPIRHAGECGIEGDSCGTLLGLTCQPDFKCKYQDSGFGTPYPDEGGACVSKFACELPEHCGADLIHPAVPGAWVCFEHMCRWSPGPQWTALSGWRFETWHPYSNRTNLWKQLYLPAGATTMHLLKQGTGGFHLEQGYDFLEVWTWKNGAWQQVARYTGGNGPQPGDEFPGRYHYLHFVSDSSVTDYGFNLSAEYRNY